MHSECKNLNASMLYKETNMCVCVTVSHVIYSNLKFTLRLRPNRRIEREISLLCHSLLVGLGTNLKFGRNLDFTLEYLRR